MCVTRSMFNFCACDNPQCHTNEIKYVVEDHTLCKNYESKLFLQQTQVKRPSKPNKVPQIYYI